MAKRKGSSLPLTFVGRIRVKGRLDPFTVFFTVNGKRAIPLRQCAGGNIGICLAKDKRHYFDFGFFGNEKDEKIT